MYILVVYFRFKQQPLKMSVLVPDLDTRLGNHQIVYWVLSVSGLLQLIMIGLWHYFLPSPVVYGWLLFCPQFFILTGDRQSGFTTLCVPSHQYEVQKAETDKVRANEVRESDSRERLRLDMFSSIVAFLKSPQHEARQSQDFAVWGACVTPQWRVRMKSRKLLGVAVCCGGWDWFMKDGEKGIRGVWEVEQRSEMGGVRGQWSRGRWSAAI